MGLVIVALVATGGAANSGPQGQFKRSAAGSAASQDPIDAIRQRVRQTEQDAKRYRKVEFGGFDDGRDYRIGFDEDHEFWGSATAYLQGNELRKVVMRHFITDEIMEMYFQDEKPIYVLDSTYGRKDPDGPVLQFKARYYLQDSEMVLARISVGWSGDRLTALVIRNYAKWILREVAKADQSRNRGAGRGKSAADSSDEAKSVAAISQRVRETEKEATKYRRVDIGGAVGFEDMETTAYLLGGELRKVVIKDSLCQDKTLEMYFQYGKPIFVVADTCGYSAHQSRPIRFQERYYLQNAVLIRKTSSKPKGVSGSLMTAKDIQDNASCVLLALAEREKKAVARPKTPPLTLCFD